MERIEIPAEAKPKQRCDIRISESDIWIDWTPALPDGGKPSRVELMAAGALIGIARVLSGKGAEDVAAAAAKAARGRRIR